MAHGTKTVRISEEAHAALSSIAAADGTTMTRKLEEAIKVAERKQLLERGNRAYAALREEKESWDDYQDEMRVLDGAMADGLEGY